MNKETMEIKATKEIEVIKEKKEIMVIMVPME